MTICSTCQEQNRDRYMFCINCGTELIAAPQPPSRTAAQPKAAPKSTPVPADSGTPPAEQRLDDADRPKSLRQAAPFPDELEQSSDLPSTPVDDPHPPPPSLPDLDQIAASPVAAPPVVILNSRNISQPGSSSGKAVSASSQQECRVCGFLMTPGDIYCGQCGSAAQPVKTAAPAASADSRNAKLVELTDNGNVKRSVEIGALGISICCRTGELRETDAAAQGGEAVEALFRLQGESIVVTPPHPDCEAFVKIPPRQSVELPSGCLLRFGQQEARFTAGTGKTPSAWGQLAITTTDATDVHSLEHTETVLGRDRGHITFPNDPYTSGTHLKISKRDTEYYIEDMGSSNGSFINLVAPYRAKKGDTFLFGPTLYRLDTD